FRSLDTFKAVLTIFVNAYNKFGDAKLNFINKYKLRTFAIGMTFAMAISRAKTMYTKQTNAVKKRCELLDIATKIH
ncbi:MAG: hypothetical protein FWF56_05990, partial [Firmicutes bacterium]|nr:hypothetical protein [Bacillota bacterium]